MFIIKSHIIEKWRYKKEKKNLLLNPPCNSSIGSMLEYFLLLFIPIPNAWFLLWVDSWWLSLYKVVKYVGRKALIPYTWSMNCSHSSCHLLQRGRCPLPPTGKALLQENYASLAWSSKLPLPLSITDDGRSRRVMSQLVAARLIISAKHFLSWLWWSSGSHLPPSSSPSHSLQY